MSGPDFRKEFASDDVVIIGSIAIVGLALVMVAASFL
jgi:hypothetical protein